MRDECVYRGLEHALHNHSELVVGESDAVVCETILREVVGANLLGAIAGADLLLAFLGLNLMDALRFNFVEA